MKLDKKKMLLIVGLMVSIICSWLFVRKIEWSSLGVAFSEAKYIYIFPTIIIMFVALYLRALRWQVLLSPVKNIPLLNLISINMIGFMANNVLPARLGEVIRPVLIARKEKIKVSTSLATIAIERVFDILGIIVIATLLFCFLPSDNQANSQAVIHQLEKWSAIMAFFAICVIATLFLLSLYPKKAGAAFERLLFIFPPHLRDKLVNLLHSFISGLQVFDQKSKLLWVFILSIGVWLLNAASVYVLCYSFDIGLSFAGSCFVTVCIALAVALPQAPGFIGVFHIATQKSLDVFGVGLSSAQSFAILLWAVSVIPVTVVGLLFLWKEGISFGEISHYDEEKTPEL